MDLQGKKILVVGGGMSGCSVARIARKNFGADVVLCDQSDAMKKNYEELKNLGVKFFLGKQNDDAEKILALLENVSRVILSPAVPIKNKLPQLAIEKNILVESEIEFAYELAQEKSLKILAITGTNGKTTTTTLLGEMIKTQEKNCAVAGNIGVPLCEEVCRLQTGVLVVEISSYQMEASQKFHPNVAGILNVTPDHLIRHGSMEVYQAMKEKIFQAQTPNDFLVLNFDDERTRGMQSRAKSQVCFFSRKINLAQGIFLNENKEIILSWKNHHEKIIDSSELKIYGNHNVENALAASAMAFLFGISIENIAHVLRTFMGVEHRIEFVRTLHGVRFFNDSKATNTDASIKAIEAFPNQKIILLLGGRDKKTDLTDLMESVKKNCEKIILFGEAQQRFYEEALAHGLVKEKIFCADFDFKKAVQMAYDQAKNISNSIVMLSPACASFDLFTCFEERGEKFKDLVNQLCE